jgi:crotonobetainyl-CoA:carnitine CoA-transferase CaiB-like acyl-CoA transferase
LSGYRVLDLSGPLGIYCGKLLADMGADVVKVEPPGGDPMRRIGPFLPHRLDPESSLHWLHFNTNKRSITLNIDTRDGRALLRHLASSADVFLETCPPGYLESIGLGHLHLETGNPGLIYASLTPYGQTGPYKDFKSTDLTGFTMGGYLYVTGWPQTPPTRLWGSQAYHTTSNRAFIAILLALYHRLSTGAGQHVDVSMQEAVAATTEHVNTAYNYDGIPAVRCGFRHGGQFIATWRCQDGYVSITTNTQQAWDDLRAWMDREGMAGDLMSEKYDDRFILRGEHSQHIEELIQDWAMEHTREEITEWGQAHHHPWGPVVTASEVLDNEQLWDRGFFSEVYDTERDVSLVYPGAPYKLSRSPWALREPAPSIGQHNREIYCGELGMTPGELEVLSSAGVI